MIPVTKRKIGICILLSIITVGIYQIYWEYLLVKNIRVLRKDKSSCTGEMLCLVFVPFYSLYWWFTRGKIVKDKFTEYGYSANGNENAYLILGIFNLTIISMAIMQNDFNSLESESTQSIQQGAMFCSNCGTKLADGTAFCPECGASASYEMAPAADEKPKPSKAKLIIILVSCLLVLALIAGGVFTFVSNTPEAVAKKYVKAYLEGDGNKLYSCSLIDKKIKEKQLKAAAKDADKTLKEYLEDTYEYLSDDTDIKIKSVNDLIKAESKSQKEYMKDEYGKYSVSVKVTDAEKLDKDDLKILKDGIKDYYDGKYIETSKIKEAWEIEIEYKIKGKDDDEEGTMTLTVVKYGMFWKVSPIDLDMLNSLSQSREYEEELDGEYVEE